jgi:uncharacterized membrane protein YbaN (DUF454 family)
MSMARGGFLSRGGVPSVVVRLILFVVGIVLILAGFALGFVPFLPGFPLGIAGVVLLSLSSRRVREWLRKMARYLPQRMRARLRFLHHQPQER